MGGYYSRAERSEHLANGGRTCPPLFVLVGHVRPMGRHDAGPICQHDDARLLPPLISSRRAAGAAQELPQAARGTPAASSAVMPLVGSKP